MLYAGVLTAAVAGLLALHAWSLGSLGSSGEGSEGALALSWLVGNTGTAVKTTKDWAQVQAPLS